jgi:hypothetical protein
MISNIRLVLVFLALSATGLPQTLRSTSSSGSGKAVNPVSFSIKGLRLHMTADEARPIMQQLAAENHAAFDGGWGSPCASETISALKEHRKLGDDFSGKCVARMGFQLTDSDTKFMVNLEFVEDLPKSPGVMRIWHIDFQEVDLKTHADFRSFFSAIADKFGPATIATPSEIIYCSETGSRKTCRVSPSTIYAYESRTNTALLKCCRFAPELGGVGFYGRREGVGPYSRVVVDLYDATFATQSDREKARMVGETQTAGKPAL